MKFWGLLILGAVSPFLFTTTLPPGIALLFLLFTLLCLLKFPRGPWFVCIFPIMFLITSLSIDQRLSNRLPLAKSKSSHLLTGVIGNLPESSGGGLRFLFIPDEHGGSGLSRIYVNWYKNRGREGGLVTNIPQVRAGERWRLQLRLRSPRGRANFNGMDAERWYFTRGIDALAYVEDGQNLRLAKPYWLNLQHWREAVLNKLNSRAEGVPAFRILTALAIADRRGLQSRDREVLSATGTGHLLAISGLHIGLAAVLGFYLGRLSLLPLPGRLKLRLAIVLPWFTAWFAALVYSALSGFGVSTQRALIMLTVATVVMLNRRSVHPLQAWLIAMSLVLLADPFAPLRAGFWFSFIAVAVLMMLFIPRHGSMPAWRRLLFAQLGISLVMAPLGVYWFQQASFSGLLANLIAIPVVSLLVVPMTLLALITLCVPGVLAGWALTIAGYSAHWLLLVLGYLSDLGPPGFSSTRDPGLAATVLAMLGAAVLLLPRGTPGRFAGLLLLLPVLMPASDAPGKESTRVDFLDVGQGLSVLLTTAQYQLLYDTGPGNGLDGDAGFDMVRGTIQPMITATGRRPDLIVASHGDLDHAGGIGSLQAVYPAATYLANLPDKRNGIQPCSAPGAWMQDKLEFSILHPSSSLPYLGNDSSCVISINGPGLGLLLSGDISQVVEKRLVLQGLGKHAILSVPHHGSSTSSSSALIDTVRPSWAVISTANGNRFGFPRADVLERYARARVQTLDTARCGGIRITTGSRGVMRVQSARVSQKAIWRWPAIGDCP